VERKADSGVSHNHTHTHTHTHTHPPTHPPTHTHTHTHTHTPTHTYTRTRSLMKAYRSTWAQSGRVTTCCRCSLRDERALPRQQNHKPVTNNGQSNARKKKTAHLFRPYAGRWTCTGSVEHTKGRNNRRAAGKLSHGQRVREIAIRADRVYKLASRDNGSCIGRVRSGASAPGQEVS
jgi:hypothetical protein